MSNNLGLDQITASQDQKETTSNDADGGLDASITERVAIAIDNTNAVTVTDAQLRGQVFFEFTDSGTTAACTANLSAIKRGLIAVLNNCGQTLTVQISGQSLTPPTIADGDLVLLANDGSDVQALSVGGGSTIDAFSWKDPKWQQMDSIEDA